ncbi:MAG: FG-GAP-like repeat-containing protein [Bacteroidota bacterium]
MKRIHAGLTAIFAVLFLLNFLSCEKQKQEKGEELVLQNCQSCHLMPAPEDLNQQTWEREILPKMAARLGLNNGDWSEISVLKEMHMFPDTSLLSREEWQEIVQYFRKNSPPFPLQSPDLLPINISSETFSSTENSIPNIRPTISLLHYDSKSHAVLYGNSDNGSLNAYSLVEETVSSQPVGGVPSFMLAAEEGFYVLTMGQIMPHNEHTGALKYVPFTEGGWENPEQVLDSLQRPVYASLGDLDMDGKEDVVISSFGNYVGELAWYSDFNSPNRKKHVLSTAPGALKTVIDDVNADGLPDILALMAQGEEGVYLYLNQGSGQFRAKQILRYPATYGSTYFEWKDMTGDGLKDILYVNGDNGDYYPIVKRFHGIRLLVNQGDMVFEEAFFLEQHGVFKVISEDFDQDNDLDLAAISYFPDYANRPQESFVYYENKGNFSFNASTFEATPSGKWLTMDAADLDLDGDKDIILGSTIYMSQDAPKEVRGGWMRERSPIRFLANTSKHHLDKVLAMSDTTHKRSAYYWLHLTNERP